MTRVRDMTRVRECSHEWVEVPFLLEILWEALERDQLLMNHEAPLGFSQGARGPPRSLLGGVPPVPRLNNFSSGPRNCPPGFRDGPPGFRDGPPGFRDGLPGFRDGPPGFRDGSAEGFRRRPDNNATFDSNSMVRFVCLQQLDYYFILYYVWIYKEYSIDQNYLDQSELKAKASH